MNRLALSAVALALGVICAGAGAEPALAEKRVALVIGNSGYQHAPALPNPARDAKAMVSMFEKAGFDVVTTQYDAGNLQFKRAIRQFEDAASEADIAVIYYAGHGIEIHGTNYLIPIDAKLASDRDADAEAISPDRLGQTLDRARRRRVRRGGRVGRGGRRHPPQPLHRGAARQSVRAGARRALGARSRA